MKKTTLFSAFILSASLSFAAGIQKHAVTGSIKWTGYGVGKTHTGDLKIKNGEVEMKGDELIGGAFVVDMTTLKTADSPKLQAHLQSPDFFDITKYPEATYKITKVEIIKGAAPGNPTHKIMGNLTIKSKTEPFEMLASVTKKDGHYTAVASTEIKDRTKYDLVFNSKQFKALSALGDKLIEDHIKLDLNVITK